MKTIVLVGNIVLGIAGILIVRKLLKFLGSPVITKITEVPRKELVTK